MAADTRQLSLLRDATAGQSEIERLRSALHCALGYWSGYHSDLKNWQDPTLQNARGEESEDYRWCLVLLDAGEEERR